MNKFKQWVTQLLQDERGAASVKPVIAILGALFLSITMTVNSFSHSDFAPADNLVDAVMIITCLGMGADSLDKLSLKRGKPTEDEPTA